MGWIYYTDPNTGKKYKSSESGVIYFQNAAGGWTQDRTLGESYKTLLNTIMTNGLKENANTTSNLGDNLFFTEYGLNRFYNRNDDGSLSIYDSTFNNNRGQLIETIAANLVSDWLTKNMHGNSASSGRNKEHKAMVDWWNKQSTGGQPSAVDSPPTGRQPHTVYSPSGSAVTVYFDPTTKKIYSGSTGDAQPSIGVQNQILKSMNLPEVNGLQNTQGTQGTQGTTDPRIAYNRGKRFTTVDAVTDAQQKLIDAGYSVGRNGADGYWGSASEAAWNKYNTDLGYNNLTNGELMKLTLDQLAGKAVTDQTRTRYNALHAALAENEAIRARNAEAEKKALTYNGKTYDNFLSYNSAVLNDRVAAEQLNRVIRDNNLKGTIQGAADLAGFKANSLRGKNHLNTANAAYEAKTAAEKNGGTWDEAGYVAGLNRRNRNRYLRMRMADSDGNIFNNYEKQDEVAMPEWYSKPELELEKTIDMNAIAFNKKGSCMYKKGKRVPMHETGNPIVYSRPEVLFLTDNFGLIDWTNYHKAGAVRPGNYVSYINGDDNEWEAVKTQDGSLPALLGIQLPNGYEKLTLKYNPVTGELMGEEFISYGETAALNDTVPYGSSFYKRASNYPSQKTSNKLK